MYICMSSLKYGSLFLMGCMKQEDFNYVSNAFLTSIALNLTRTTILIIEMFTLSLPLQWLMAAAYEVFLGGRALKNRQRLPSLQREDQETMEQS